MRKHTCKLCGEILAHSEITNPKYPETCGTCRRKAMGAKRMVKSFKRYG